MRRQYGMPQYGAAPAAVVGDGNGTPDRAHPRTCNRVNEITGITAGRW